MLDKQLKQGVLILDAQVKHQKEYLHAQADQQLKQFDLELTLEVQQQEMQLSQQYVEQTMKLQQQAQQQKSALEQQALQLTMEYEQRKSEEEMALKQFKIDQEQFQMQQRMSLDFSRLSGQQPFQMGGASTLALMGNMNGSYSGFAPPTVMSQYPFQTAISGSLTTTAPAVPAQSYSQRGFNPAGYTPDKQVYVYGANGELIPKRWFVYF